MRQSFHLLWRNVIPVKLLPTTDIIFEAITSERLQHVHATTKVADKQRNKGAEPPEQYKTL